MNLEIRHLQLVVEISEEKSVTKAGEKLCLTQSALSHQLREIETRLGTPLFFRLNKRMILTQSGERILSSAKRILGELKDVEADVAGIAASKKGVLRISTECYTCYHWLPKILKDFNNQFPDIEIKIVVEATRKPISVLLEGKLDIAIISNLETDKRLQFEPLFSDEMVVIMSPYNPLAKRDYIRAEDLNGQNYLAYTDLKENTIYQQLLLPNDVKFGNVSQVRLTEAIIEMVTADLGIAILARWAVARAVSDGSITTRPLTDKGFIRQWFAAYLRTDSPPDYFSKFIQQLQNMSTESNKLSQSAFVL